MSNTPRLPPSRYPKAGRTNPFVNVFVASVSRAGSSSSRPGRALDAVRMPEPNYFRGKEKIVYAAAWATNSELALTWENRWVIKINMAGIPVFFD